MEGPRAEGAVHGGALNDQYGAATKNSIGPSQDVRERLSSLLGQLSQIQYRLEQIEARDADELRDRAEVNDPRGEMAYAVGGLEETTERNAYHAENALETTAEIRQELEAIREAVSR